MKGQISRFNHKPEKRYSGLYQIQGAMVTDADLIEATEIDKRRVDDLGQDAIGDGVPVTGGALDSIDSGTPSLKQGVIYADGVRGQLAARSPDTWQHDPDKPLDLYTNQADFPAAPELPKNQAFVVYADLWERPVFHHEDHDLTDPGLHRAETSFRTRTMTQIKAAPAGAASDIEAGKGAFPPKGNGVASVVEGSITSGSNECDPCAEEITVGQTPPNALFRLEVIAVTGPANNPASIVFAWSQENASVVVPVADKASIKRAGAVYEHMSVVSESHRGVFADPDKASRPVFTNDLDTSAPNPATDKSDEAWTHIRRWDGWATKDLTADKTIEVDTGAVTLTVDFAGKSIVAGDYWLVELRRFAPAGKRAILASLTPMGVTHHYCVLFEVDANGSPVALTDAQQRKLSFPALSDIPADHVSLKNNCPKLYHDAENVQEALDALCELRASDVKIDDGTCPSLYGDAKTVQQALKNLCDADLNLGRFFRLLFDWGVICGLVPSLKGFSGDEVVVPKGTFLDRAGAIGEWPAPAGGLINLNTFSFLDGRLLFRSDGELNAALRSGSACLAVALDNNGKTQLYVAPESLAFGPAEPSATEIINKCVEQTPGVELPVLLPTLSGQQQLIVKKMLGLNSDASLAGRYTFSATDLRAAASSTDTILNAYERAWGNEAGQELRRLWDQQRIELDVDGVTGQARQLRETQWQIDRLGMLVISDANRRRACVCKALFPACPPAPGDAPHLVPIACLKGSYDGRFKLSEVCPVACRKQALSWRLVNYYLADARAQLAQSMAAECCGKPFDLDIDLGKWRDRYPRQWPWPPKGPITLPELQKTFRFDLLAGFPEKSATDYRVDFSVDHLAAAAAADALRAEGVKVVKEIDLTAPGTPDEIAQITSQRDAVIGAEEIRPGDKVALLTENGEARGYILLERGFGKPLFEAPGRLGETGLELGDIESNLDRLEQERSKLSEDVISTEDQIRAMEERRTTLTDEIAAAEEKLDRINTSVADAGNQLETMTNAVELAETLVAEAQTSAVEAQTRAESAKAELLALKNQRDQFIGDLRGNLPLTALGVAPDQAGKLAREGIITVQDFSGLSPDRIRELARADVINTQDAELLVTSANQFMIRP